MNLLGFNNLDKNYDMSKVLTFHNFNTADTLYIWAAVPFRLSARPWIEER